MEPENFERALRAFARRKPFDSFAVRFMDGSTITVDHPEALIERGGVAVHISSRGEPTPFDHGSVSQFGGAHDKASV